MVINLVEETLSIYRMPRAKTIYQFLLGMVLAHLGFSSLNHFAFCRARPDADRGVAGRRVAPTIHLLAISSVPASASSKQLLAVQQVLRQRVWKAAHVQLDTVTLDTDTTVHTLYGQQMQKAHWQPSPKTDADQQCEFWYQPSDWGQAYRFIALRYKKEKSKPERERYQLFDSPQ